jgi:sphinganine-1-phosphate aldolase
VRITLIISRATHVEQHLKSTDGGDDMEDVLVTAFRRYCVSNPLHPDVFPAVRKMEAEIVAICLRMYNNPTGAGATTSGGTESILMSVKTHRDWARAVKGISEPEMYISHSLYVLSIMC